MEPVEDLALQIEVVDMAPTVLHPDLRARVVVTEIEGVDQVRETREEKRQIQAGQPDRQHHRVDGEPQRRLRLPLPQRTSVVAAEMPPQLPPPPPPPVPASLRPPPRPPRRPRPARRGREAGGSGPPPRSRRARRPPVAGWEEAGSCRGPRAVAPEAGCRELARASRAGRRAPARKVLRPRGIPVWPVRWAAAPRV